MKSERIQLKSAAIEVQLYNQIDLRVHEKNCN